MAEDFPYERISDYPDEEGALVWVDLCDPDPERLQELAEELSLDPHAVEDALAKVERANGHPLRHPHIRHDLRGYRPWMAHG